MVFICFYFFTHKQVNVLTETDLSCHTVFLSLIIHNIFLCFSQLYQRHILYIKTFYFHICILNLHNIKNNERTFSFHTTISDTLYWDDIGISIYMIGITFPCHHFYYFSFTSLFEYFPYFSFPYGICLLYFYNMIFIFPTCMY